MLNFYSISYLNERNAWVGWLDDDELCVCIILSAVACHCQNIIIIIVIMFSVRYENEVLN